MVKLNKKSNKNELITIPSETVFRKIFVIRNKKVMFDKDLAFLYGVETRALNQAVRRNMERFPEDFMFKLNKQETKIWKSQVLDLALESQSVFLGKNLKSQIVTSSWGGGRYSPYVFTEQGVAMLSSVLRSKKAIKVNIQIMRTFTKMRELLSTNKELREKIEKLESKYDQQFKTVFQAIQLLLKEDKKPKNQMGFRKN